MFCTQELSGTFTMIDAIEQKLCLSDQSFDVSNIWQQIKDKVQDVQGP